MHAKGHAEVHGEGQERNAGGVEQGMMSVKDKGTCER